MSTRRESPRAPFAPFVLRHRRAAALPARTARMAPLGRNPVQGRLRKPELPEQHRGQYHQLRKESGVSEERQQICYNANRRCLPVGNPSKYMDSTAAALWEQPDPRPNSLRGCPTLPRVRADLLHGLRTARQRADLPGLHKSSSRLPEIADPRSLKPLRPHTAHDGLCTLCKVQDSARSKRVKHCWCA